MKKHYFGLFDSREIGDKNVFNDIKKSIAECNGISADEVSDEWVYDSFNNYLDEERQNLDIETGGYIVAFAQVGLWFDTRIGYRTFGTNVRDIFNYCSCDDGEWYADRYNVRANLFHHDGMHHLVFRYVESREDLERVCDAIYNGGIESEKDFFRMTKSIRPFIAKTYGWKEYGKQAHKAAA